jgi:hypothetical protein
MNDAIGVVANVAGAFLDKAAFDFEKECRVEDLKYRELEKQRRIIDDSR